ncbi:universal stress protein [Paraburkholderia phytofirmans]|nr:universal stress protein [Paraburkholderia phytofirmans]
MNSPVGAQLGHRPFNRLMIAVAGGMGLTSLARYAMRFAGPGATVRLVSIVGNPRVLFPTLPLSYSGWHDAHVELIRVSEAALAEAKREIEGPSLAPETELLDLSIHGSHIAQALSEAAQHWDATLVAIAAHPRATARGWGDHLDPEDVAAMIRVPVLYVPSARLESGVLETSRVLVAVDGSETALQALCAALAALPQVALWRVVYVVDSVLHVPGWPGDILSRNGTRALDRAADLLKAYGRTGGTALIDTSADARDIHAAIAFEADRWGAQLVVMGTRGRRTATRWLLGSVAERTLRSMSRPLLVCPPVDVSARGAKQAAGSGMETARGVGPEETEPPILP